MAEVSAVFLSYAHRASLSHARALKKALDSARVATFQDEIDIADGDSFPEAIVDALLRSRVVVIFSDPVYFEREYCIWELEAALTPARLGAGDVEFATTDHVVLARPAHPHTPDQLDRFPPAIRVRQWPRASETNLLVNLVRAQVEANGPTLGARLGPVAAAELRTRLLEGSRVPLPAAPRQVPRFPPVLPASLREGLVGRSGILWRLDYLLRTRCGSLETTRPTVAIEGGGGAGKTRLALEYVHRYGHRYAGGVFWVDADTTPERREEQLHGILRALRPDTPEIVILRERQVDIASQLADALCAIASDAPALYVVDGLPEPGPGASPEPITRWCPAPGHVALLVASRLQVSVAECIDPLPLPPLSRSAAVALLTDRFDRSAISDTDWNSVVEWVGRLPLALVLLNAALRMLSLSPVSLLGLASSSARPAEALDRQMEALRGQVPVGSLRGITEAFALSYALLSPDAQSLGRVIACLAPGPVPEALLDALGQDLASFKARATLVARSYVTSGPSGVIPIFGQMHGILADFLKTQSTDHAAEIGRILAALLEVLPGPALEDPRSWPVVNAIVPHASLVADEIDQIEGGATGKTVAGSELRSRIAITRHAQGDLVGARTLKEEVLAARRRVLGLDHPDTLTAALQLALTCHAQGELVGARALLGEVLSARRRILGREHPDTLIAAYNVSAALQAQGDLAGARELLDEVVPVLRRILGPEHPDTLNATHNLAATLHSQGDLVGARVLKEQVHTALQRIRGSEHPDTLGAANNLANTLRAQGELVGARALQDRVFASRQRILGPEHPDTLNAAHNLAAILHAQGDLVGARDLEDRVLASRQRILGPEHPDTLTSALQVAATRHAQGDLVSALALVEDVLEARRRILGLEHPDTLAAAHALASMHRANGVFAGALARFDSIRAALRRLLGA